MYTIVGSGRLARHFAHYFRFEGLPFTSWSRRKPGPGALRDHWSENLGDALHPSSQVLLLISDSAIEPFIDSHPELEGRRLVHCSGSLLSERAPSAHPLMTFTEALYPLETYRSIPFIVEAGRGDFAALLPGLSNPGFPIPAELKPLYHSLCVLSGNFTTLLWSKFFRELDAQFGIPAAAAHPYLERIAANLRQGGVPPLTGPLARRDFDTIRKNLEALEGDPYVAVYRAFLEAEGLSEGLAAVSEARNR